LSWFLQLAAEGKITPALEKKPALYPDLVPDYKAFIILSASRRIGMVEGPIPISDIKAYCEMFDITDYDQKRQFLKRIKILDRTYLEFDKGT